MTEQHAHFRSNGSFMGKVVTEWKDQRSMVLLEPIAYRDMKGKTWYVPKGSLIDGASIPRPFWSLIGSPYVGRYRQASIVHDYYCQQKPGASVEVHRMFHEASLISGVHPVKAALMYAAVRVFGPSWPRPNPVRRFLRGCRDLLSLRYLAGRGPFIGGHA